jgi:SpoVK/Ycf46/Vps4 family AAA+-type ATPase
MVNMSIAIKEMDRVELVNLERLAHILKGLSAAELETLELLLDEEALKNINQSLKELEEEKGIPINEW